MNLSPEEKTHIKFMEAITHSVQDSPMVLKGGTALLLTRGLDRFSEDLDFDSSVSLSLDKRIQKSSIKAGVSVDSIKLKKNTPFVKRYIVNYRDKEGSPNRLKIETKIFDTLDDKNIETVDGVKTYKVSTLISQKLEAGENRAKVRDLYDLNYLAKNYSGAFDKNLSDRLSKWAENPDSLVSKYKKNLEDDSILKNKDLELLALDMNESASKIGVFLLNKEKLIERVNKKLKDANLDVSVVNSKSAESKTVSSKDRDIER